MAIVLGCAGFSLNDIPEDTAAAVIEAALDGGIDEFDTARAYTTEAQESHNEELLGIDILESVGALDELRSSGKAAAIGVSNVDVDQLRRVRANYEIEAVENRLSLYSPDSLDVLRECERHGVRFLAYSPLGGSGARPSPTVDRIARSRGVSAAQVALAWLLSGEIGADPVVGATRAETARDSAAAGGLKLRPAEMAELNAASAET